MQKIIPYDREFIKKDGFITSSGKSIYVPFNHEKFAQDYCDGPDYDYLFRLREGIIRDPELAFKEFKKEFNYTGERWNIDLYMTSKLSKAQLNLYKLWIEKVYYTSKRSIYIQDFLITCLSYDKVTSIGKYILTTNCQPHIRLFNYYLMDWTIFERSHQSYSSKTKQFEYDDPYNYLDNTEDRQYEEEINEIKRKVLLKDRYLFFK